VGFPEAIKQLNHSEQFCIFQEEMMRSSMRVFVVAILGFLFSAAAMAEDSSPVKKDSAATASATTATTPQPASLDPVVQSTGSSSLRGEDTPAVTGFAGFSFVHTNINGGLRVAPVPAPPSFGPFNLFGGTGSIQGNIRDWFGLKADFGGYAFKELNPGTDGRLYTYMFGPVFSARNNPKWTPYFHTLFGVARLTGSAPGINTHANVFGSLLGGGVDWNASRHIGIRLFQAEYLLTKFNDGVPPGSGKNRQNGARLSTGIVFNFGYPAKVVIEPPKPQPVPQPPTISCSANPSSIIQGGAITIRTNASSPQGDKVRVAVSSTCGVNGNGEDVSVDTTTMQPGSCTVTCTGTDEHQLTATSTTSFTVEPKPNHPPTMTCAADKTSVVSGDPVTITATASDPDGDPLTYNWTTSGGKLSGSGASVQLDSSSAQGAVTVGGHVEDGRGGAANCQVSVEVTPRSLSLHSIYYPTNLPTKANPDAGMIPSQKQTLNTVATDFKRYLQVKPDARLLLEAHADSRGSSAFNLALSERRVGLAKKYLVQQGVPETNLDTKAHGKEKNLTAAEVKDLVEKNSEMTAEEKARTLKQQNLQTVVWASNRRVDITLESTGQTSVRQFPFNTVDALSLIGGREKPKPVKPVRKPAARKAGAASKKGAAKKQ
jgi:hypothetical protein